MLAVIGVTYVELFDLLRLLLLVEVFDLLALLVCLLFHCGVAAIVLLGCLAKERLVNFTSIAA